MIKEMFQKLLSKKLNKKGFTLIELIIVIVIIAILAAVMVPLIIGYVTEAQRAALITNARLTHTAVMSLSAIDGAAGIPTGTVWGAGDTNIGAGTFNTVAAGSDDNLPGRVRNLQPIPAGAVVNYHRENLRGDISLFNYRETATSPTIHWHPNPGPGASSYQTVDPNAIP